MYLQDGLTVPGIGQRLIPSVRVFSFEFHGQFYDDLSVELGNFSILYFSEENEKR